MASIDKRENGTWRARWREYPGGPQRTKAFNRKVDAQRHLVSVQHDLMRGTYVEPAKAKVTLGDYAGVWLERMRPTWRPATGDVVESSLRRHVLPVLGQRPLTALRRADVEAWAASLALAPTTVATVRQHLGQVLTAAVDDGLIPRNPALGARLPRRGDERPEPVALERAEAIAAALPLWARVLVPLGLGVGLRQGEACGLTVDRVDFLRRMLRVTHQLVTPARGAPALQPPKTLSSARSVPLADVVLEALSAHLAAHGAGELGLVVHQPDGRPLARNRMGDVWRAATKAAGCPGVRYHDLRHTFASTLLSQGVSIKAVADWLGHASPTVTLSTYAHLMPVDDDRARAVLDSALGTMRPQHSLASERVAQ